MFQVNLALPNLIVINEFCLSCMQSTAWPFFYLTWGQSGLSLTGVTLFSGAGERAETTCTHLLLFA